MYHLLYIWEGLVCLTCLIILKYPLWLVWTSCPQDHVEGTILYNIICELLNVELFFKEHLSLAASLSWYFLLWFLQSSPKPSKVLVIMKCYHETLREIVCNEVVFKKSFYLENLPIHNQNLVVKLRSDAPI